MTTEEVGLVCDYCGAKREKILFMIGASRESDNEWTLWECTSKVSCPNCHPKGAEESRLVIKKVTESRY